jgi:signal transduction histidine kinase
MEVMLDQLRAEPLETTGLIAALKKLCESIGFRTGAQVEFKLGTIPPAALSAPGAAEAILRVAQEALANVARHARASHVTVSLDSANNSMQLTVTDDGAGFDPAQDSRGMGSANMRARAEELGGTFNLTSAPNSGTTIKFSLPYGTSPARYKYRNRAITFALLIFALVFNSEVHHWSFAPALLFVAALAVIHYVKAPHANLRRAG